MVVLSILVLSVLGSGLGLAYGIMAGIAALQLVALYFLGAFIGSVVGIACVSLGYIQSVPSAQTSPVAVRRHG